MTLKDKKILAQELKKKYHDISKKMFLVGVTGTNGKTTTTTLCYQYLRSIGEKVTLIGSNGIWINDQYQETINTTPGIKEIYQILFESYHKGVKYVIMEVSSHGIHQYRVAGLHFRIKLITNLTNDHLDYHKTIENYKFVKGKFLKDSKRETKILVNGDMSELSYFQKTIRHKIILFGEKDGLFTILEPKIFENGIEFQFLTKKESFLIKSNLVGDFNISNLAAFLSIITIMKKFNYQNIQKYLAGNIEVSGRMKQITWRNKTIIIDFAHTPDGVKKVLLFLKKFDKIINLVVGCGGNRDSLKRPMIGKIATEFADFTFFTSDNPRYENPQKIIADIIRDIDKNNFQIIIDRQRAIFEAIINSPENSIIAILGRGNEIYQHINGQKIAFSDIEFVEKIIREEGNVF